MHSKKEVIVAAIDTGKRWSKSGMYDENEEVIRLQTSTSAQKDEGQMGTGYKIKYMKKDYVVGDDDNVHMSENSRNESKLTPEHKISTLTGLALLLDKAGYEHQGESICLGINVPITEFKDKTTRPKYEAYYEGTHEIKVGAYDYSFEIKAVYPLFEGYGTLCRHYEMCLGEEVLIINFGSLNTTFVYFENMVPKTKWTDSFDNGCNALISRIQSKVNSKNRNFNLSEKQIHKIVDGDKKLIERIDKRDKTIIPFIFKLIEEELDVILTRIRDFQVPLETSYIICTGGGALLYKNALEKVFKAKEYDYYISEDPLYDDVEGFLEAVYDLVDDAEEDE